MGAAAPAAPRADRVQTADTAAFTPRLPAARRHRLAVRAQEGSPQPPPQQDLDGERRLEALEAGAKARKGVKAEQAEAMRPSRPARASSSASGGVAEWKEGQLFPEGEPAPCAASRVPGPRARLHPAACLPLHRCIPCMRGMRVYRCRLGGDGPDAEGV